MKKFRNAVADNPELKNNPALESLRKTLLKEPLEFFKALRDRLQADRDTRPESLAAWRQARFDMGMLTGEIGDKQDALIAYRESLAIRQKLADANPASIQFQSELAASHDNIGVAAARDWEAGRGAEGVRGGLAIRQKLADANPTVTQFQSDLASSHGNIGIVLSDHRQARRGAEGAPRQRWRSSRSWPTPTPPSPRSRATWQPATTTSAILLSDDRQAGRGAEGDGTALAIRQKLADANPAVTQFQSDLAASHDNIGVLLSETGKPAEALKCVRGGRWRSSRSWSTPTPPSPSSRATGEQPQQHRHPAERNREAGRGDEGVRGGPGDPGRSWLTTTPPSPSSRATWRSATTTSAILLSETGKPAEALKSNEAALAIRQKLADANPTVTEFQSDLARSHNNIGHPPEIPGKPGEA